MEASSYYSFSSFFFKNSNYTQDKEREINSLLILFNNHTVPEVELVYFCSCVCRAGTGNQAKK